ncbi:MAG TPA: TolC family protein [Candidatus Margulisiibacteriota bacterium]|nr:TolC family protein [Candidatus Margulisiibacteriota bacterium]
MRRLRNGCVTAALLVVVPAAFCGADDDDLGGPLKLDTVVAYARQHNPEIRAAVSKWHAAEARPAQAGSLPDPMVDVAYHNESFDRLTQGSSEFAWIRIGASQEVPFPGKLGLKQRIATTEAEETHQDSRRIELEVIGRVKMAYAEYAHLFELLDLLGRNRDLLQKFARTAEVKYSVGEGIQQDVLRAHVELSLLVDRETSLEQRRQSQTAELNGLLNRPPSAPLGTPQHSEEKHLTRSLDESLAEALEHAPEVNAAQSRVNGSESMVALARRDFLPDFVLRADYMNKASLQPEWEVGVGVKVPLHFATKQSAGVDEAAATLAEAHAEHQNAAVRVQARIRDLYARAQAAERLIALYRQTIIPQAHLALESATSAYSVNKADFLTLLNSFTVMLEYEMRYHEELSNFQKAVAELEAVVGEPVEG